MTLVTFETACFLCPSFTKNLQIWFEKNNAMIFFETIKSFLKDKDYRDLLITTNIILSIGTVVYHYVEGWTWLDSLYFSVITLTTIGYGDFSPATDAGKVFTLVYIIVGLGVILSFIQTIHHHYSSTRKERKRKTTLKGQ